MPEKNVTAPLLPTLDAGKDNKLRSPKSEVVAPPPYVPVEEVVAVEEKEAEVIPDYNQGLKSHNLTTGQAREIMEKILVKGFYEEDFRIAGTILVRLRTRTYADSVRTQNYLESESPTYNLAINEVIARYNLAASLAQFGDIVFTFPEGDREEEEKAFQERYRFVMSKPYVVINKLQGFLYLFDRKVAVVFADGAPEDF